MVSPLLATVALVVAIGLGALLVLMAAYRMAIQERFDAKAAVCLLVGAALVGGPLLVRPQAAQPVVHDRTADVRRLESDLQAAKDAERAAEEAQRTASVATDAIRKENATLLQKLEAVRKELQTEREKPSVAAQPIAPNRTTRRRTTRRRPTAVRRPAKSSMGPDWVD